MMMGGWLLMLMLRKGWYWSVQKEAESKLMSLVLSVCHSKRW
jgi:hypothetical protein